jgi:hypothetical protein
MSADHDVGYKKPPKAGQFKTGKSGNPKGRPKGSTTMKAIVEKVVMRRVPARIEDSVKWIPMIEFVLMKLLTFAGRGDMKAFDSFVKLAKEVQLLSSGPTTTGSDNSDPSPFAWTEEHESLRPFIEHMLNAYKPDFDEDA